MENNKSTLKSESNQDEQESFTGTLEAVDRREQDAWEEYQEEINRALRLAYTDKQTGCYNRSYYEDVLSGLDYKKYNDNIILIVVDVNDLGLANNKMGYKAGDKLLDNMSRQLKSQLNTSPIAQKITGNEIEKGDTILARVGGDEFVIMRLKTEEERNDPNFETNFEDNINNIIYKNKPKNLNFAWGFTTFDEAFDEDLNDTKNRAGMIMHKQKKGIKEGYIKINH